MKAPIYLNDWDNEDDMLRDFGITKDALDGAEVLVASYTYEACEGDAYVLLQKGDQLFEVFGSHCSCYGLSESSGYGPGAYQSQWEMEPTDLPSVLHRVTKGRWERDTGVAAVVRALLNQEN